MPPNPPMPPTTTPAWVQEIGERAAIVVRRTKNRQADGGHLSRIEVKGRVVASFDVPCLLAALSECAEALWVMERWRCRRHRIGACNPHDPMPCGPCLARRVLARYESGEIGR